MKSARSTRRTSIALVAAAMGLACQLAVAATEAEIEKAREEIRALVAHNHELRSRYVMDGARFAKKHRDAALRYDVGAAEDEYEGALGYQSQFIGYLGTIADNEYERDQFGLNLDTFSNRFKMAQRFESEAIAKYDAVRNTSLSKSDRECYERLVAAARMARQVHEDSLFMAVRYIGLFGGGTAEEYAAKKQRIIEAEQAYYAERAERRKITDESALLLLVVLLGMAYDPPRP